MPIDVDLGSAEFLHGELTHRILVTFFAVYNELGAGFLESVYRVALSRALQEEGLRVEQEWPVDVFFTHAVVARFHADLVVDQRLVLQLKAVRTLLPEHNAQLIHYLRATTFEVGLLLNFGKSPEFKRLVYSNGHKKSILPS